MVVKDDDIIFVKKEKFVKDGVPEKEGLTFVNGGNFNKSEFSKG